MPLPILVYLFLVYIFILEINPNCQKITNPDTFINKINNKIDMNLQLANVTVIFSFHSNTDRILLQVPSFCLIHEY